MPPLRREGAGLLIDIRLTPRGGADRIDGVRSLDDGRIVMSARVRAVPEDGKANKALEALIARTVGVARSAVSVVAGHQSRMKTLKIEGVPADDDAMIAAKLGL